MIGLKIGDLVRYSSDGKIVGFISQISPNIYRGYKVKWFNWYPRYHVDEMNHSSIELIKVI
ncbi:MAG: hypothetical protein EBS86_14950 [Crocinitomicaceae bacterium]|jgi:hypothetical protein|nr:hypothetical protein [Crocinitomicaceae bacterium]